MMYQGVVFLDIEKLISKSTGKMNDSIKQTLLMMQQNDYLLVICSPFPLEMTAHLMGKKFRCAFILFNGRLVILNEQTIVSFPIAKKVINEIRKVCKHTKHSLAYYTRNFSLFDHSDELINRCIH